MLSQGHLCVEKKSGESKGAGCCDDYDGYGSIELPWLGFERVQARNLGASLLS